MDRYIGLDVHMQSSTLAVVGARGKRIQQVVVETTSQALVEAIQQIPGPRHLCLEEGTQSAWLYELLEPHVQELVVFVPPGIRGNKSDALDAWAMAEQLRRGALPKGVYKEVGPFGELRAAVKTYGMVKRDVVRVKNRLCSVYRARGLLGNKAQLYDPAARSAWQEKLPPAQGQVARMLAKELDLLEPLLQEADEQMKAEARKHPEVRRLETAPAIGPVRAAQIVATVVVPHRFRTKRQFWSYCGLGIVTRSSADWQMGPKGQMVKARRAQTRGLNPRRQALLKEVFKGAAHQICTQMTEHPLHKDFVRLVEGGTKSNLAELTIARRLAAAVLSMWKTKTPWRSAKQEGANR
jgi:transposase